MSPARIALGSRWMVALGLILVVGAQFVGADRTNPPSTPGASLLAKAPPDVRALLERSCRDCHSNDTSWPWYSHIAPVSWLLTQHVNSARGRLNLSEWTSYTVDDQDKFLGGMCTLTTRRRMPLKSYLWIHRSATLSDADVKALCAWTEKMRDALQ